MKRLVHRSLAALVVLSLATAAAAQESKSGALAKQLGAALDAAKLDSIAAKDPSAPDIFVAALYFQGGQLLVVSAKYAVPQLLVERLNKKEFRDTYIDLNSASVPDSKVFVEDAAGDGLKPKVGDNQAFDTYEAGGKRTQFDGEWKKQKLTEQEYMKIFSAADERYSEMLMALLAQLKKTS
jgi:type II secretory pathway pseudopilin PulG